MLPSIHKELFLFYGKRIIHGKGVSQGQMISKINLKSKELSKEMTGDFQNIFV